MTQDTVLRIDTVFVGDTVEVCPEGWECIPPPEPTVEFVVSVEDGKIIGELAGDSAAIADTRMVGFYINGTLIRNESVPAFCLGGGDASPCAPYTPTVTGELTLLARRYLRPDGTEDYTEVVTVNPNVPPEPPDSTPTEPPDTVPPAPGDSIIGTITLGTPTNIRIEPWGESWLNFAWDPIPEDTVTTCVGCGTWWERQAVINDPDVIGDEIYYMMSAWSGSGRWDPENPWQFQSPALASDGRTIPERMFPLPDTLTACVQAIALDALSYTAQNPGGGYVTQTFQQADGSMWSRIVPVSEVACTVIATQSP